MANRVSPDLRYRCFLCDKYVFPWAMVREYNEWVCRACVNYEGNFRLPHAITNARRLKALVKPKLDIRVEPVDNVAFHVRPGHPIVVTVPPNRQMAEEGQGSSTQGTSRVPPDGQVRRDDMQTE